MAKINYKSIYGKKEFHFVLNCEIKEPEYIVYMDNEPTYKLDLNYDKKKLKTIIKYSKKLYKLMNKMAKAGFKVSDIEYEGVFRSDE